MITQDSLDECKNQYRVYHDMALMTIERLDGDCVVKYPETEIRHGKFDAQVWDLRREYQRIIHWDMDPSTVARRSAHLPDILRVVFDPSLQVLRQQPQTGVMAAGHRDLVGSDR